MNHIRCLSPKYDNPYISGSNTYIVIAPIPPGDFERAEGPSYYWYDYEQEKLWTTDDRSKHWLKEHKLPTWFVMYPGCKEEKYWDYLYKTEGVLELLAPILEIIQ